MIELLVTSLVVFVALVSGCGIIVCAALIAIVATAKVSDMADKFGCWVEWVAMLALLWLFAFALSVYLR